MIILNQLNTPTNILFNDVKHPRFSSILSCTEIIENVLTEVLPPPPSPMLILDDLLFLLLDLR